MGENDNQKPNSIHPSDAAELNLRLNSNEDNTAEIGIIEILKIIGKYKKFVLIVVVVAAFSSVAFTLIMPNWYTATAKILPPQQSQSNAVAILGQLGALSGGATQALGIKNPSDVFVAMLKSRSVADVIIERFRLKEVYVKNFLDDARNELKRNANISAGRDGVITIEVDDTNAARAANIANSFIEELEKTTLRLAVSEAGQRRLFFEKQLSKVKEDLTRAESELEVFQRRKGMVNPQSQASLTIAAAAGLRAQIAAKEVQIASLGSFATEINPDLVRAREELAGLRLQMAKISRNSEREVGDVLVALGSAPESGQEFVRKYRDVKYSETLYELLAKHYELARIDEAKNATLIQVLDRAIPPERKSKPRRALIAAVSVLLTLVLVVTGLVIRESYLRRLIQR